jgi:uncharacterized protein YbcC (UPF0753/DUF2309 family)
MNTMTLDPIANTVESVSTHAHPSIRVSTSMETRIETAGEQACAAIAPAWPLDRAIAVNPHWARVSRPVREVAARMAVLGGIDVFPSRSYVQQAWREGRITEPDLAYALRTLDAAREARLTAEQCVAALIDAPHITRLPLLIDVLDDAPQRHTRLSWRQAITHQVSQTCAAYFDEQQADWQPERGQGLYAFWRDTLTHDHGIGVLMGLPELGKLLDTLPATRQDAERWVIEHLGLPEAVWADYLEAVLLTVNGWASWCAYLGWEARLAGNSDSNLRDLLAIRLAWGGILLNCKEDAAMRRAFAALQSDWAHASELLTQAEDSLVVDELWQVALEAGYQRQLAQKLVTSSGKPEATETEPTIEAQAAFCIDVRSEPLRRAIETISPATETIGFAGFFGLPIAYTPLATQARRPQLPGLLAPGLEATDRLTPGTPDTPEQALTTAASKARQRQFAWTAQWQSAARWPSASFFFVEAAGVGYLGKLANLLRPKTVARVRDDLAGLPTRYQRVCRPGLADLDTDAKVELAATVLHAMGLDRALAPLVLLVGHGSQSSNNAHAAALDCGACCGQTGEVNARVLAQLLNDSLVRDGLARVGVVIPVQTSFVAALHNTTTDEIEAYDVDLLPAEAQARLRRLLATFERACEQVRRERAPSLGIDPLTGNDALLKQLRRRANDRAQTRPEWGLAGNAAFIIAPRKRTRRMQLDGRSFLHDYDASADADGSVLELLMTAPMLVTHWINWQYHASTCAPQRLGSGNKTLHNVVGGRIGVFEGNGGDLRIGLSHQSLHDGQRWMHEPLRLTVIIDAPAVAIERVIQQHEVVRQLIENGWLHLWRFDGDKLVRHTDGRWQVLAFEAAQS